MGDTFDGAYVRRWYIRSEGGVGATTEQQAEPLEGYLQ